MRWYAESSRRTAVAGFLSGQALKSGMQYYNQEGMEVGRRVDAGWNACRALQQRERDPSWLNRWRRLHVAVFMLVS